MNIEPDIFDYLETTSLEPHDDYTSEITYKDQKIIWNRLKQLQQELNQYKNNWEELKKYVKETFKDTITVSNGIIYENKPIYEEISNKMKELEKNN